MSYKRGVFTKYNTLSESRFLKIDDLRAGELRTVFLRTAESRLLPERYLFRIVTINDKMFSFHAYERHCELRDKNGHLTS